MKKKILAFIAILSCFTVNTWGQQWHSGKIPIDGSRWYQINNTQNGLEALVDGKLRENVQVGWGLQLANWEAWYPLLPGEAMRIDQIKLYDWQGVEPDKPFELYAADSLLNRTLLATFTGSTYDRWVGPNPQNLYQFSLPSSVDNIKYLIIKTWGFFPSEMELYGQYRSPQAIALKPAIKASLKNFTGVNGFEWNIMQTSNVAKIDSAELQLFNHFNGFRHYMDWQRLEVNEGNYAFNPLHAGSWPLDTVYAALHKKGVQILTCLQNIPQWMVNTYPAGRRLNENSPVKFGRDRLIPQSYIEQGKMAFQFAARYGRNKNIDTGLVKVNKNPRWTGDPINQPIQGLGLVNYMECNNEVDKWWHGRDAYQTAIEYAANLSAFYDGHMHTMGNNVGVKTADTTMQVVMSGIALARTDYVKAMVDWCKQNRGYRKDGSVNLCWDIINFHYYSNDSRESQAGIATSGTAPELTTTALVAQQFINTADTFVQQQPVWVTETGYDINPLGSTQFAKSVGKKNNLQTQADWILRTSLLYARCGINKVFYYGLYDNAPEGGQYNTSGLADGITKKPRPAANLLSSLNTQFGDFVFEKNISQYPAVDCYADGKDTMFAFWMPTDAGKEQSINVYIGNTDSIKLLYPNYDTALMRTSTLFDSQAYLQATATETPAFAIPFYSPLQFTFFKAQPSDKTSVALEWQVTVDSLVQSFEVQRKSAQGASFVTLGQVAAQRGSGAQLNTYRFTDNQLPGGVYQYRLVANAVSGKKFYSPVTSVASGILQVYPNPCNSYININGLLPNTVNHLFVINNQGRLVAAHTTEQPQLQLPLQSLLPGTYTLMSASGNWIRNVKFLKL